MFASEMIDKSSVVGAGDDDPADFTFADGANVAVISDIVEFYLMLMVRGMASTSERMLVSRTW